MENKPFTRNNGFTGWLDEFAVKLFAKEKATKVATVKLENLPKVSWNDGMYHVDFEPAGAVIYNEFGNVVANFKGLTSVEQVDAALNEHNVVAQKGTLREALSGIDFYSELQRGLSTLAGEFDPEGTTPDVNGNAENAVAADPIITPNDGSAMVGTPADPNSPNSLQNQVNQVQEDVGIQPAVNPVTMTTQTASTVGDLINSLETEGASVEDDGEGTGDYIKTRVSELELGLKKIMATLDNLAPIPQEYARHDLPEVGYPTDVMEQDHFGPEADEAMAEINREDNHDSTTPEGRATMFKRLQPKDNASYAADIYESTTDEEPAPGDATPQVYQPHPTWDNEHLTEGTDEQPTLQESHQVKPPQYDSATQDTEEKDGGDKKEIAKVLNKRDVNILKQALCPTCGEAGLRMGSRKPQLQALDCQVCKAEYAVYLPTDQVFKRTK